MKKTQTSGLIAAIAVFAASYLIPASGSLSRAGILTLALTVSLLIILATKALPLVLACFICLGFMPVFGITGSFSGALSGFSNAVVFFIAASFILAEAYSKIPFSKRILVALLKSFGNSVRSMLFIMMLGAALLSSIVPNVPVCAMFMAIGLSFLDLYHDDSSRQRAGRAFMIGIPVASMIGGMMTPVGSSLNIFVFLLLEKYTGLSVSFVQWMCAGIPVAVFSLPAAWFFMVKVIKPDEIDARMVRSFVNSLAVPERMETKERKVLIITALMIVFWIASSWIPGLNIVVISLLGGCAMFLPGIRALDMKTFLKDTSWEPFFLAGTLLSMGAALENNGVTELLVSSLPALRISAASLTTLCSLAAFVLLVIIPVAPAIVVFISPVFIAFAGTSGVSPAVIIMALGLCACNCYLLPLDTVTRLTYGTGYYSAGDMLKSTLPLQIWLIILIGLWVPLTGKICGLG